MPSPIFVIVNGRKCSSNTGWWAQHPEEHDNIKGFTLLCIHGFALSEPCHFCKEDRDAKKE